MCVFLAFLIAAVILFGPGYRGELLDDGLAGLVSFENKGCQGFWQSFGFTSLYYVHDIAMLAVYKLAGKSDLGWFAVMVVMHCMNATLGFVMFKKLYALAALDKGQMIALGGAVLFLLSPYQTENVLWAATLHYAVSLTIFLFSAILLLNALQDGQIKPRSTALVAVLYCMALMTLEISLVFPFAYFVIGAGIILIKRTSVKWSEFLARFIFPLLAIIPFYFLATRVIKGHWLPHYGEAHLLNNNIQTYSTNSARYLLKMLGYIHYVKYPLRDSIYSFCLRWKMMLVIELLLIATVFVLLYLKKKKTGAIVFITIVMLSFILLVPSLHMYFMYLFNTQNDRLGYFFSLALYQALALVLISLFSYAGLGLLIIYGIAGMYFLHQQALKWTVAGRMQDVCVQSFTWTDSPEVVVLNEPAYYKGVYVFRSDERLLFALDFYKKYKDTGRIKQIFSTCTDTPGDSTVVEIKNDSTLHVKAITSGWLMHESLGAVDYGTADYYTQIDKWDAGYEVVFHHKNPGTVYIYLTPSGFRNLDGF
jgi:hypothetical protein